MKPTTVLTALVTLLATSLCTLGSAEAGMIKIINNSHFVLGVGVNYIGGSKDNPTIINPKSTKPGLGSPVKSIAKIRMVNITSGTDPGKALLKEYQETAPHLLKDYVMTVDSQGTITIISPN